MKEHVELVGEFDVIVVMCKLAGMQLDASKMRVRGEISYQTQIESLGDI